MLDRPKYDPQREIAEWLCKIREEKGISQESLGVQIGKGQSDIAKMEGGTKKVTILELVQWVAALGLEYERLEEIIRPLHAHLAHRKSLWKSDEL